MKFAESSSSSHHLPTDSAAESLQGINRVINTTLNLQEVLQRIVSEIVLLTNARLYQEKEQALQEAQRQAEALRISEERFRALAENTYDLLCEIDREGRFIYLSPNYQEVTGF